ncbi:HlyC/CorC family transporter [Candidatus Woesearchaeota archaeon]|jgi:putative hemolysin|nr:HlyC/CorC family transporter [Candidatus Woesearchaeota archaeon]
MSLQIQIVSLAILLFFSGLFSGIETAFFSLSNLKLRSLLKKKKKGADVAYKLKQNPKRLIITILIGNNVVNIGAASLATIIAIDLFGSSGAGIATGVMTFLVLIFGEITPKSIANTYCEKITLLVARPLQIFMYSIFPLILLFEAITEIMYSIFKISNKQPVLTEEEFKTLVEIGAEEKVLKIKEKELIEGVLEFSDITAKEVMTPRTKTYALDGNMSPGKALKLIAKSPFSRVPVYEDSVDNILGVIHIKDVLRELHRKGASVRKIKKIVKKPYFVPETKIISELFKEFQEKKVHIAFVVDEYGGISGIVTLEDLLEEIVGEIIDETDINPDLIMRIDHNTIVAHGETEIYHINEFLGPCLAEDTPSVTISGLILEKLKQFPKKNAKINLEKAILKIEEVSDNHILKVRITKKKPESLKK